MTNIVNEPVFLITESQINEIINHSVVEEVAKQMQLLSLNDELYITRERAADILDVDKATISNYVKRGVLNVYECEGISRYRKQEVIELLQKRKAIRYS